MITNFRDSATEDIFNGIRTKEALKVSEVIWAVARRKLDMLNAASDIMDLRVPPGNRLEALKGKGKGLYSIRVNDQFRVVFRWTGHDAYDVQIVDYHS